MIYGGLPQIVSCQSERQKADYLKNIFANVSLKDVIERNTIHVFSPDGKNIAYKKLVMTNDDYPDVYKRQGCSCGEYLL